MSELPPTDELPAPRPTGGAARPPWKVAVTIVVAAALGLGGAVLVSDAISDEPEEAAAAEAGTARPLPVLSSGSGSALSDAVALYGIEAWSSPTRGLVLSAWGAAFSGLLGDDVGGVPADVPDAGFADDPRLLDPTPGPGFIDPCAGAQPGDPVPDECPTGIVPGEVLEPGSPPGNAAAVVAFPHPDVALAAECPFADVAADEIPLAIITGNPGRVEVSVGSDEYEIESEAGEVTEWEAWLAAPDGPRPPSSFVAHCIAVPEPGGTGLVAVTAVAEDDEGQVAVAETTIIRMPDGLPPATVTPIDGTMVRIDVPMAEDGDEPYISTQPVAEFGVFAPTCDGLGTFGLDSPGGVGTGWRVGNVATAAAEPAPGDRPWLEDAPALRRFTVPLPEGEPSLLCLSRPDPVGPNTARWLLTPPDARRLRLAVTELDVTDALAANDLQVRGTFAELGWTPCGALLPAVAFGPGSVDPGPTGVLCSSGGDTGAIAAAGGVLDLGVRAGAAGHEVRLGVSAVPGGAATDVYRIPIPAPDFEGILCTDGVDQPGCVEPEGDAVLGTLEVTASWDEGPVGPSTWAVQPAP